MKIYTKRGDAGRTSLFDGADVSKSNSRVAAYGDVDELNAHLGVARAALAAEARPVLADVDRLLEDVQRDLFALGAVLADPRRDEGAPAKEWSAQVSLDESRVEALERAIDAWDAEMPALTAFILPGGTPAAAALHVARTIARRAERAAVGLLERGGGTALGVRYLNRLSDLLFVAARLANHRAGGGDVPWK